MNPKAVTTHQFKNKAKKLSPHFLFTVFVFVEIHRLQGVSSKEVKGAGNLMRVSLVMRRLGQ